MSVTGDRAIQKAAYLADYCDTVCKYDKSKHKALAANKRYSSRIARRHLADDLRRQIAQ